MKEREYDPEDGATSILVAYRLGRPLGVPVRVVDVVVVLAGLIGSGCLIAAGTADQGHKVDLGGVEASRTLLLAAGFVSLCVAAFWTLMLRWRHERLESINTELVQQLVATDRRERRYKGLFAEVLRAELDQILTDNGLWSNERVTFYVDDPRRRGLVLAARWSRHPLHQSSAAREPYD